MFKSIFISISILLSLTIGSLTNLSASSMTNEEFLKNYSYCLKPNSTLPATEKNVLRTVDGYPILLAKNNDVTTPGFYLLSNSNKDPIYSFISSCNDDGLVYFNRDGKTNLITPRLICYKEPIVKTQLRSNKRIKEPRTKNFECPVIPNIPQVVLPTLDSVKNPVKPEDNKIVSEFVDSNCTVDQNGAKITPYKSIDGAINKTTSSNVQVKKTYKGVDSRNRVYLVFGCLKRGSEEFVKLNLMNKTNGKLFIVPANQVIIKSSNGPLTGSIKG